MINMKRLFLGTANKLIATTALTQCVALTASPALCQTGGWYLLVPPVGNYDKRLERYEVLNAQPLSKWAQHSSHDSALECEAVKESQTKLEHNFYVISSKDYVVAVGKKNADPFVLKHMKSTTERADAQVNSLMASRCIKSDDPRLGK